MCFLPSCVPVSPVCGCGRYNAIDAGDQSAATSGAAGLCFPAVGLSCGPFGAALADGSEYTGSYLEWATDDDVIMK